MTPEVAAAVAELRAAFADHGIDVTEEGQGGAYVLVHDLPLGGQYTPAASWCGFLIPFHYPRADVYPHYFDPTLRRVGDQPLGDAFSGPADWNGRRAWQVSRKSNRWDPANDTAATKLAQVLDWVRSR